MKTRLLKTKTATGLVLGLFLVLTGCKGKSDPAKPGVGNGETYTGIVITIPGVKTKSLALQSDGKIVAGTIASSGTQESLFRYNANLSIDTDFGAAGKILAATADQVFPQAGDKVVTSGYLPCGPGTCLTLQRYNADGSLDATFGSSGSTATAVSQYNSIYVGGLPFQSLHVQTQPAGQFVVAGAANANINPPGIVQRYSTDGILDTAFAQSGSFTTNLTPAEFLTILPDGAIRVGDGWDTFTRVLGLSAAGVLDTAFGLNGVLNLNTGGFPSYYSAISHQSDGKILLVGGTPNFEPLVVRYNVDGSADSTFGAGGRSVISLSAASTVSYLAVQPDDKIIVGTTLAIDTTDSGTAAGRKLGIGLSRLNVDGTLDTTFGNNGTLTYDLAAGYDQYLQSLDFQPNGEIIVIADATGLNSIATNQVDHPLAVILARLVPNR